MYKIIGNDQKIYGPVPAAQLRQWQVEGRINNSTLVLAEGSNDWKPLSSVPEFGVPPVMTMPPAAVKPNTDLAAVGLTFGILSNFCCCFGVIFAVLGIIFSAVALSRHETQAERSGKGMAVAGLILSVVGLSWRLFVPLAFLGLPGHWMQFHRGWHNW